MIEIEDITGFLGSTDHIMYYEIPNIYPENAIPIPIPNVIHHS
jgi:hypothetical protein